MTSFFLTLIFFLLFRSFEHSCFRRLINRGKNSNRQKNLKVQNVSRLNHFNCNESFYALKEFTLCTIELVWPTIFYSNVGRDKNFFHRNSIRIKNKKLECHYLYRTIFNKMIKFPGLTIHFTLPFYWVVTQINRWISAKLKLFYSIKYISQTWINYWFFKIRKYLYLHL